MENIGYISKNERQNSLTGEIERELIFTIGCDTFKLPVVKANDYLGKEAIKEVVEELSKQSTYKFVNKNKKLRRSKLFLSKLAYEKLCANQNVELESHRKRVEQNEMLPEDLRVMATVFRQVTTIIK